MCIYIYICIYICIHVYIYIYNIHNNIYIYIHTCISIYKQNWLCSRPAQRARHTSLPIYTYTYTIIYSYMILVDYISCQYYGQFSEFNVCFCGLDSGNLKFETVRTNKQHICF